MTKASEVMEIDTKRRGFIKKAAYAAPAIVTMVAVPSFASAGSGYRSTDTRPQSQSFSGERSHRRSR